MNTKNLWRTFLALAILFTMSFLIWSGVRIYAAVDFSLGYNSYAKLAANASTVELALRHLDEAIGYVERQEYGDGTVSIFVKNQNNNVGIWRENLIGARDELRNMPEDADITARTNLLMKLREVLMDSTSSSSDVVTHPSGISVYPNNVGYFWWCVLSTLFACAAWCVVIFKQYDWC